MSLTVPADILNPGALTDVHDSEASAQSQIERRLRFERIVADHHQSVARLAQRLLGWSDGVDDIVQDVFLAAWEHLDRFEGRSSMTTWLSRITINRCRTHQRRIRWRFRRIDEAVPSPSNDDVQAASIRRERSEQVRRSVRALPVKYREVIVLRYLQELSIETIADLLEISRNAVEVRLHRARRQLGDMLGDELKD